MTSVAGAGYSSDTFHGSSGYGQTGLNDAPALFIDKEETDAGA